MTAFQAIFGGSLVATCLYAVLRGGAPERIVAGVFVVGAVLSRQVEVSRLKPFHSLEIGILHVDLAMFGVFVGLALWTTRFWPMIMASLQGTQVLGHFAHLLDHEFHSRGPLVCSDVDPFGYRNMAAPKTPQSLWMRLLMDVATARGVPQWSVMWRIFAATMRYSTR